MLASIIINNHNYGRYLGQAIASALQQTYRPLEVIVVDDGSTDDSRAVIAGYSGQVTAILKANGGQASAFNAGFAHSHGEIVIFLDADDMLAPHVVEEVVRIFTGDPAVAKVHYRLEIVHGSGTLTGIVQPLWTQPLLDGDLRRHVLTFPDDLAWQPTTGNAFAARVLRQILPMPEPMYRVCADYYLASLPPLFGPVAALETVGGYYRVHGANHHHATEFDLERTREIIVRTWHTHRCIGAVAEALGLAGFAGEAAEVRAVTFMAHRLVSLRLAPERHPLPGDRAWKVLVGGLRAALGRFDRPRAVRALYMLWFAAAFVAPRAAVKWLAAKLFYPDAPQAPTSGPARLAAQALER